MAIIISFEKGGKGKYPLRHVLFQIILKAVFKKDDAHFTCSTLCLMCVAISNGSMYALLASRALQT
jgi:hypothetical protein